MSIPSLVALAVLGCSAGPPAEGGDTLPHALVPPASASASSEPAGDSKKATFDQLLDTYLLGQPDFCRWLGMHAECDGRVADYSAAGIAGRIEALEWIRTELAPEIASPPADPDHRLDVRLLDLACQRELFSLTEMLEWQKRPKYYEELFALDSYLVRDYAPLDERAAAVLKHATAALPQVANIQKNLVGPMPKAFVTTDIKVYKGYGEYLRGDVVTILGGVRDAKLREDSIASVKKLAAAADDVAKWLETNELPRADASHVLGKARFEKLLRVQEALDTPLDVLEKMAADDLAKNKKAYEDLEKKGIKPKRPKASQLLEVATALVGDSRAFIEKNHLATIPEGGKVVVKESPPFMRWNAAFLNGPGPFDAPDLLAYYYITLPDPKWSKKEQDEYVMSYGTLLATSVHEVLPGHFLQGLWNRKAKTRAQKALEAYSFVEGWAHYGEQMMVDEGFRADDPATRMGQLGDALLRNCRFVASIGIHVKGMSASDVEKMFVDDCKQDKATAREQAARGTFDPGYFAYTLGKLQIIELREEVKRALGAKFDLGRFHDALLSHGGPQIPILREYVMRDLGIDPTQKY
ncbi:MAG TPA: DUF885 domain-containing protein [Polyangiaceae bacterium]|nr:DUF885 domain-containing protein [Polyangiaceae bacterium]